MISSWRWNRVSFIEVKEIRAVILRLSWIKGGMIKLAESLVYEP